MEKSLKIHKHNRKYIVLWSAIVVNFLSGLIYMWSILSKSFIEDLHWTSKEASLPYTIFTVSFVIAMVISGKAQDSKGPRLIATLGAIFMGSGVILSGIFTTPKMMTLTIGILTGAGVGMITVATSPPVVKWFPSNKAGLVTGLVVGGAGLAATMYAPLASYLITTVGIQRTLIYIGGAALTLSVIVVQGLMNPPENFKVERMDEKKSFSNSRDFTWQEMLKSFNFYKIWIMLAFSSSAGLMIIGHISTIAHIQAGWEAGFILVILLSIFNTLGRILGGTISDKIGRINLMKLIFLLQGINMIFFPSYLNKITLGIGVSLAGLCYGASFSVFPSTISDLYGTKNFGINYGLMFTGWGLGGIIGPMVAATMFDMSSSYNGSYKVAFVLLVISILIALSFKEKNNL